MPDALFLPIRRRPRPLRYPVADGDFDGDKRGCGISRFADSENQSHMATGALVYISQCHSLEDLLDFRRVPSSVHQLSSGNRSRRTAELVMLIVVFCWEYLCSNYYPPQIGSQDPARPAPTPSSRL